MPNDEKAILQQLNRYYVWSVQDSDVAVRRGAREPRLTSATTLELIYGDADEQLPSGGFQLRVQSR